MKRVLLVLAALAFIATGCSDDANGDANVASSTDQPAAITAPTTAKSTSFTVAALPEMATDDELLKAALAAQNTIACPAFGGGAACIETAGIAKGYLEQIQAAVRGRDDNWTVVYNRASDSIGAVQLLSGTCASTEPGNGNAKAAAACLDASDAVTFIQQDIRQAIAQVHRDGS